MRKQRKTVYVGFKFPHMGVHAGYDLIRYAGNYDLYIDCQDIYSRFMRFFSAKNLISRAYGRLFGSYMLPVEWRCLLVALKERDIVFHFIYAENTYRYLGLFKWLGFKIVCTYHQPTSFFKDNSVYLRGVKFVDKVIVLSDESRLFFSNLVGSDRVKYIPHGVDTDFFSPSVGGGKRKEVLMVGNWMRNFEFANLVFQRLLAADPEVTINVVSLAKNAQYFSSHVRLKFFSGISDQELLEKYRSATVLFLPLNGFVANNAVLEMASVGAPIVVSSNQAPDETLGSLVSYVPLDQDLALDSLLTQLNRDPGNSASLREFVLEKYSWSVIGKETRSVMIS